MSTESPILTTYKDARNEFVRKLAYYSPAGYAFTASYSQWEAAPHLVRLTELLLRIEKGELRRLMVFMPPRHGKSELISRYFPAWYLARHPDRRVILASYESDFAASWGRKTRDTLNEWAEALHPNVKVNPDSSSASRWDILGHTGGMITAGAGGPITGRGGHLIIIDDPVKNAEEANSRTIRERVWEWYRSTLYTRLEPGGAIILIMTRWHEDDLAGRIIADSRETGEEWEILNLPAIAEENDPLGRQPGEALWPARFPREELDRIRLTLGSYWWNALYMQRPLPPGGEMFKREWFAIVEDYPRDARFVRFWDIAGTAGGGDYTVGALLAYKDGIIWVVDVTRGQWSPAEVETVVRQTAEMDGKHVPVRIEEEGGGSGKALIHSFITRIIPGWDVRGCRPLSGKETRANPLAALAEAGNLRLVRGGWNRDLIDEFSIFPRGDHDDIVDAVSGGYAEIITNLKPPARIRAKSVR